MLTRSILFKISWLGSVEIIEVNPYVFRICKVLHSKVYIEDHLSKIVDTCKVY